MKSILFLTTANLATNPRLLKEVVFLSKDYKVNVIMFTLGNWSDTKTMALIEDTQALQEESFIHLHTKRKPLINWMFWGLSEKLARMVYPMFKHSLFINAVGNSRRSIQLYLAGKNTSVIPDFICAHNIGALYPAWKLSKKWSVPFFFDVEDYHPGEFIQTDAANEKCRREFLMKKLLPEASAITSASPLIGKYTLDLIGGHAQHHVLLNSFPQSEFSKSPNRQIAKSPNQLKLVWFSQKISFGRGLEQLFEALQKLNKDVLNTFELTLVGEMDELFKLQIIAPSLQLMGAGFKFRHIPPLTQPDLHAELANHDLGLAFEPGKDLNNNLALSNKIIAYAQAGLFILATDTPAQRDFMEKNLWSGLICGQSVDQITGALVHCIEKANEIGMQKTKRYHLGKNLSWEKESKIISALFFDER